VSSRFSNGPHKKNSDYFPVHCQLIGLYNAKGLCSSWRMTRRFHCNLDKRLLQMVQRSNMGLVILLSHCMGFKFYISIHEVLFFFLSSPCNVTTVSVYIQFRIVTMFVNVQTQSVFHMQSVRASHAVLSVQIFSRQLRWFNNYRPHTES
jgi:hypothetical protein